MRADIVRAVFRKELREMLRDRRSLLIMFGVPLLLYPLLTLGMAGLAGSQAEKLKVRPARVILENGDDAPHLVEMIRSGDHEVLIVDPGDPSDDATTGATRPASTTAPATRQALEREQADAIIEVPPNAEARLLAGESPEIVITLHRGRFRESSSAGRKVEQLLKKYEAWVIEQRLARRGVEAKLLEPLATRTVDLSTGEQRLGSLVGGILPLFLLLTGTLGAFFPALNATTTERERGTLESLLAAPVGRTELLVGKGLLVLGCGLLTAALNLVSMALVMWRIHSAMSGAGGGALGGLTLDVGALVLAYLAAVPTLIFLSALVMIIGLLARTYAEANAYATPVLILPVMSMAIGIMDPATTNGLLLTPIANTTVLIRDVLTGKSSAAAFALASGASLLYAALLLSAAARLFATEQLVNPGWEPLSFRGFGRRKGKRRRPRLPAIDEALALFAAVLLLNLYFAPDPTRRGLLPTVAIVELLIIAGPPLLLAWLSNYRWRETFLLRPPAAPAWLGAALIGIGIAPWVQLTSLLQHQFWPQSAERVRQMAQLFLPALQQHPVLAPLVIGLLAGVCEELLFRGPIQTALLRKLPVRVALLVGAALFAALHMDLHGFPIRMGLGYLLGWVAWRTGSIVPAMTLHAVYDATQLGFVSWELRQKGMQEVVQSAGTPPAIDAHAVIHLVIGAGALVAGTLLVRRSANLQPAQTT